MTDPKPTGNPFAVLIPPDALAPSRPDLPAPSGPSDPPVPSVPASPLSTEQPEPRRARPVLVLPDGQRVSLDVALVIGRNPTPNAPAERAIALDGAQVSRAHARIWPAGDQILVDDLGSRNGTWLTAPGGARQRIVAGTPLDAPIGSVIHFGAHHHVTVDVP